jgi:DNA-binding NtrC family response regulator
MADILIIDDDRHMRLMLTRVLQRAGHAVREAENGFEGVTKFRERCPTLVISDILMPRMEGIETILALRREDQTIPIVAISGGRDPLYLSAAGKLGATAILEKPFAPDALLSLVNGLLGGDE